MEIYVENIPKGTRPAELKKLLKESIRSNIFSKLYDRMVALGRIDTGIEIDIRKRRDNKRGAYRYGKIRFHSQRLGSIAVEALEGTNLRGSGLVFRPFVERSESNDRRNTSKKRGKPKSERRLIDRRQH